MSELRSHLGRRGSRRRRQLFFISACLPPRRNEIDRLFKQGLSWRAWLPVASYQRFCVAWTVYELRARSETLTASCQEIIFKTDINSQFKMQVLKNQDSLRSFFGHVHSTSRLFNYTIYWLICIVIYYSKEFKNTRSSLLYLICHDIWNSNMKKSGFFNFFEYYIWAETKQCSMTWIKLAGAAYLFEPITPLSIWLGDGYTVHFTATVYRVCRQ